MTAGPPLADWPRPHYVPGGNDPFLFYVVHGPVDTGRTLSRSKYRFEGVPDGIDVMAHGPAAQPDVVASFRHGILWDRLAADDPGLAAKVAAQDRCLVVRGTIADPPTLNYFRDVIGLLTFALDAGGVAIYDPQMLKWWTPSEWRSLVFDAAALSPRRHVGILVSDDGDGTQWFHTRGMRKFGRPDLSVHRVTSQHQDAVIELCNRFIELQAFGGVVADGREIRMGSLPGGMRCVRRGDAEDPDFNNEHIELLWPGSAGQAG
jgi:hypothetical protein